MVFPRPAGPCGRVFVLWQQQQQPIFYQVCCSVSRVSDVTLESFWVGFSDLFVLQGHGVSPSGRAVWPCFCAVAAAAAVAAAKFLASFLFCFSGFRRDVREFLGGILGLVRPSGPWCFPVRQGRVAVFLCSGSSSSSQFCASFLFCFYASFLFWF